VAQKLRLLHRKAAVAYLVEHLMLSAAADVVEGGRRTTLPGRLPPLTSRRKLLRGRVLR